LRGRPTKGRYLMLPRARVQPEEELLIVWREWLQGYVHCRMMILLAKPSTAWRSHNQNPIIHHGDTETRRRVRGKTKSKANTKSKPENNREQRKLPKEIAGANENLRKSSVIQRTQRRGRSKKSKSRGKAGGVRNWPQRADGSEELKK